MFIWDFVANPVMESILDWFYSQMVGFLGAFFARWETMGVELFDLSWVWSVVRFFSQLGLALFAVSVVVSAFECGIEYASGRGNLQQPALNALKGFFAVSLFTTVPVRLYALSVSLQGTFAMEITGAGKSIGELGNEILTDLEGAGLMDVAAASKFGLGTNPIMLLFAMILMAYAVIKVFFSNLKRGGILLIQIAVGSLYMVLPSPGGYTGRIHPVVQAGHRPVPDRLSPIHDSGGGPYGVQGPCPAGAGPHALRGGGAQNCRHLRPGHHDKGQHHERGLHSTGRRQHHTDHRGCGGAKIRRRI